MSGPALLDRIDQAIAELVELRAELAAQRKSESGHILVTFARAP